MRDRQTAFRLLPAPGRLRRSLAAVAAAALVTLPALPVWAAEPDPCPAEEAERQNHCQTAREDLARLQRRLAATEALVRDPEILLVRVEPEPGEGPVQLQRRVARQGGVRTLATNSFLPVGDPFFNPETGALFVTLGRRHLWQYVGEALGYDSPEALQVFRLREDLSNREKQNRFLTPGGELDRLREQARQRAAATDACCGPPPAAEPLPSAPVGRP